MTRNTTQIGFLALLLWCVSSAIGKIFNFNENQLLSPYVVTFYMTLLACITFFAFNKDIGKLWGKCRAECKDVFMLNLSTFGAWTVVLYCLKYMEPSLVDTIALCITPIATIACNHLLQQRYKKYRYELPIALMLVGVAAYTALTYWQHKSGLIMSVSNFHMVIALIFCIASGGSSSVYIIYSKRLFEKGFSLHDVIGIRFCLLLLFAFLMIFVSKNHFIVSLNTALHLILLSVVLIIVPVYLILTAIKNLHPITVAIGMPFMPALTLVFEHFDRNFHFSLYSLIAVTLMIVLTVSGSCGRFIAERRSS